MFMYGFNSYSFQTSVITQSFQDCLLNVCDRLHIEEHFYSAQQQRNADTIVH